VTVRLILLSRIDGDATRAINYSAPAFWIVRGQAVFNSEAAHSEHPTPGPSRDYRFSEANPIRRFFLFPLREEGLYEFL